MMTRSPFVAPVNHSLLDQATYLGRKIVPGLRRRLVNRVGSELAVTIRSATSSTVGEELDRVKSAPAALATLSVERGRMALIMEGKVLSRLLAIMLGADPASEHEQDERAALTRIDLRVGARIAEDLAETLTEQLGVEVVHHDTRSVPRTLSWASRSTKVVVLELDFGPEDAPYGRGALLVPLAVCNTVFGTTGVPSTHREAEVERVLPLEVNVVAELARIPMRVAELPELRVGSVIDLGVAGEIILSINGKPALVAEAGEADGVRSVRILRRVGVAGH